MMMMCLHGNVDDHFTMICNGDDCDAKGVMGMISRR